MLKSKDISEILLCQEIFTPLNQSLTLSKLLTFPTLLSFSSPESLRCRSDFTVIVLLNISIKGISSIISRLSGVVDFLDQSTEARQSLDFVQDRNFNFFVYNLLPHISSISKVNNVRFQIPSLALVKGRWTFQHSISKKTLSLKFRQVSFELINVFFMLLLTAHT